MLGLLILHVPSKVNLADLQTKQLSAKEFFRLMATLQKSFKSRHVIVGLAENGNQVKQISIILLSLVKNQSYYSSQEEEIY